MVVNHWHHRPGIQARVVVHCPKNQEDPAKVVVPHHQQVIQVVVEVHHLLPLLATQVTGVILHHRRRIQEVVGVHHLLPLQAIQVTGVILRHQQVIQEVVEIL